MTNDLTRRSRVSLSTSTRTPPKGIYLVAVVFFVAGLICMTEFLTVVFAALGFQEGLNLATLPWVLTAYVLALCLVCYGVALLTRLHPAPQWLMLGMTLLLTVQLATAPAGDSPFHSALRIYLNRFLLVLPMIASCVYLRCLRRYNEAMRILIAAAAVSVLGFGAPAWAQVELIPRTGLIVPTPTPDDQTGFVCPMHPDIMSHEPGKCPRCGMTLVAGDPLMASDFRLTVEVTPKVIKPGQPVRFRFTAVHPLTGQKVSSYAIVHDKPYHLFLISRDMEFFEHLHPTQEKDGSFVLDVTLPKAGRYLLLSDFFPEGGGPQVISTHIATAGYDADVVSTIPTLVPETTWDKTANGVRAQLKAEAKDLIAGEEIDLPIHFEDVKTGAPVKDLQRYLGAFGHMLVMSEDMLDYVHSHPEEQLEGTTVTSGGGPDVVFHAIFPRPGRYRVWLQYQRNDTLSTVSYTLNVMRQGETSATP